MTAKKLERLKVALARAMARAQKADLAERDARNALRERECAYLEACGWKRVWTWPHWDRLWLRGEKTYTHFAAVKEQAKTEKRRARAAHKKPVKVEL